VRSLRARHGALGVLLTAICVSATPNAAIAAPQVSSFRFLDPPQAGRVATLEIHVRDDAERVDDVHVYWGDGAVTQAKLSTVNPLEPLGSDQRVTLDHSYARPGGYWLGIEAFSPSGAQGQASSHVAVGPCGVPRASATFLAPPRAGRTARLKVVARDDDSLVRKIKVGWGDGTARALTFPQSSEAEHGDQVEVILKHTFGRPGRLHMWLKVASSGNPRECTGAEIERTTKRWTIGVAANPRR
jgi:acyl dehydratase